MQNLRTIYLIPEDHGLVKAIGEFEQLTAKIQGSWIRFRDSNNAVTIIEHRFRIGLLFDGYYVPEGWIRRKNYWAPQNRVVCKRAYYDFTYLLRRPHPIDLSVKLCKSIGFKRGSIARPELKKHFWLTYIKVDERYFLSVPNGLGFPENLIKIDCASFENTKNRGTIALPFSGIIPNIVPLATETKLNITTGNKALKPISLS